MHEEIKVLIVEDEASWMRNIAATLADFGYTVAGTADNFESAVALFNNVAYDIVLLDIKLGSRNNGIELGKMLRSYYRKPFVFITGSTDSHVLQDAIDAGPSAYLIKPAHPSSLIATLQSAINNFQNNLPVVSARETKGSGAFFVKQGNKYKKIHWGDAAYLVSEKNYTTIFNSADKTEYFIRSTLSRTMNFIVPPDLRASFIQVNRAEAVNLAFVQELAGDEVRTQHKTFTLTEAYKTTFRQAVQVIS